MRRAAARPRHRNRTSPQGRRGRGCTEGCPRAARLPTHHHPASAARRAAGPLRAGAGRQRGARAACALSLRRP
eukprot:3522691-Lingulodinium_polyedra.AAC.1